MPSSPAVPSGIKVPSGQMPVLSPPSVHYHGHPVVVYLSNPTGQPMTVHAEPVLLKGGCAQYVTRDVTVTPARFVIRPHRTQDVTIAIASQAHGDFGTLFVVPGPKQHGIIVSRAVGEQVYDGSDVHSCVTKPPKHSALVAHHESFPLVPVVLGIAFVMLAVLALITWRSAKRHRTT